MGELEQLINKKRVILVCGPGGVGKTTISAAIALFAANQRKKVLVLTIDPAKRLANAMGLSELGNEKTLLNPHIEKSGIKIKGELWGMMLDVQRTFDSLIKKIAPNEQTLNRILSNKYYQTISDALAGSHEYMASEKLYEIFNQEDFDLIVMDTPPSRHALDFLDAPKRLFDFLEGKVIHWFITPYALVGKFSFKLVHKSASFAFKIMEKFTGIEVLQDLAEFFVAFESMYDGFKKRAKDVYELLGSDACTFVIVSSTKSESLIEAKYFIERLISSKMPVGCLIFNRVLKPLDLSGSVLKQAIKLKEKGVEYVVSPQFVSDAKDLLDLLIFWEKIALADSKAMQEFSRQFLSLNTYQIFALPEDIHDISGLLKIKEQLFNKDKSQKVN